MLYLSYPQWIKPEIVPGLPFRWYAMMYLIAFGLTYLLVRYQLKQQKLDDDKEALSNLFFFGILGLLLGARIFSTLVYDQSGLYWRKPWLIFWPFNDQGAFVGLQGMSFHGGAIGLIVGGLIFCKVYKKRFWQWADMVAAAVPLGYTFGRLGNFINGELYGRVTTAPWGIVFPSAESFSTSEPWVKEFALKIQMNIAEAGRFVNLPRHPSQLYEGLFEGIVLWLILWFVIRKIRPFHGFVTMFYMMGYGVFRFVIEYFREPDRGIGFPLQWGGPVAYRYRLDSFLNFTLGQILCFVMVATGVFGLFLLSRYHKKQESKEASTLPKA